MSEWHTVSSAPDSVLVITKIEDGRGTRNEQKLRKRGRLWWTADGNMYVYYTPTHWRELRAGE